MRSHFCVKSLHILAMITAITGGHSVDITQAVEMQKVAIAFSP
ncbi:hypothetical protein [Nostoc sp. ChiSLP03a]|nr:hypothetical protein [Nostoc sp. ChiSLP03a]MDZ8209712.1 hypothetical protein [Nostoc sp. ChiSLP03a]